MASAGFIGFGPVVARQHGQRRFSQKTTTEFFFRPFFSHSNHIDFSTFESPLPLLALLLCFLCASSASSSCSACSKISVCSAPGRRFLTLFRLAYQNVAPIGLMAPTTRSTRVLCFASSLFAHYSPWQRHDGVPLSHMFECTFVLARPGPTFPRHCTSHVVQRDPVPSTARACAE
jgi:hypothetical protein